MYAVSKQIFALSLFILGFIQANAQRNCGTVEYMNQLNNVEPKEVLENWIFQKLMESPSSGQESFNVDNITPYQIPVVVHIVHNGEDVGVGSNISESQILSQIEVLNEDFRKLNADSINIPDEFRHLYSDIGFEFVLAKRDPMNGGTSGITRIQGSQTSWSLSQDVELKSHDYWSSQDYLNIWVAPLSGNWLGWAQYPESDILDGLSPPYNETTDGVVINYNAFGSILKDPTANLQSNFDRGRTATHELGHFFGLRHIWGDGGCGVDDYVTDTPTAEDNYTGCPSIGGSTTSCSSQDMFMNYMDYVYDQCMNIFSLGQKDRMVVIIENSPRRLSLTTSLGLIPPNSEDLALMAFVAPTAGICDNQISTIVEVKNLGISFISASNLSLYINNTLVANQDFDFKLDINQSIELTFSSIDLVEYGNLEFTAIIETVNGTPDRFVDNNSLTTYSLRTESVLELNEDFSIVNPQWTVRTNQEVSSLSNSQSVFYSIDNSAAVFDYYNNATSSDAYISPKLVLGSNPKTLLFDYSYGFNSSIDEFMVMASVDCGNSFIDTLFSASGESLGTALSPVAFYPSGAEDWSHTQIDLSKYINQEVIFSFTGISGGGNRILFDNIHVVDNSYHDIALVGLNSPSIICSTQNEVLVWVENKGVQPISELDLQTQLESTPTTVNYSQLNLLPGERISLPLPVPAITSSAEITVSIITPDSNPINDSFTQTIIPNIVTYNIPLREKFESSELPDGWTLTGKGSDHNLGWDLSNNRLEFIGENSPSKGLKEMIVLPVLDMESAQSASMHFDFAYAFNGFDEELLRVKATTNCGQSYQTLFIEGGEELATSFNTTSWVPSSSSDWKNIYVDLSDFAGNSNVQIVIELISAQGNNAFVNNIELYASNIIEPLQLAENTITAYPNPSSNGAVNISFNLNESQPAKLYIYNSQGQFVLEEDVNNALNQTFEVATLHLLNGMYFARIIGNKIDISRSFMVSN